MIIDVARQIALKQYRGDFSFEYDCPAELVILPSARIDGKVKVFGEFEIYDDDSVGVSLKLRYTLSGVCSYCLEPAQKQVEYESDILFLPEDDGENYSCNGFKINLTTAVNDAVLFSQPQILLCRPGCKGIEIK